MVTQFVKKMMELRYEVIKNWDTKKVIAGLHVKKPITDNVNQFITNLIKVEFPWLQFISKRLASYRV